MACLPDPRSRWRKGTDQGRIAEPLLLGRTIARAGNPDRADCLACVRRHSTAQISIDASSTICGCTTLRPSNAAWASFFDLKKQASPGIDGVTRGRVSMPKDSTRIDDLHDESIVGRIERGRPSGAGFRSLMADCGRWGSRRAEETRSSSRPLARCFECIYATRLSGVQLAALRPGRGGHQALDALCSWAYRAAESELGSGMPSIQRLLRQHRPLCGLMEVLWSTESPIPACCWRGYFVG